MAIRLGNRVVEMDNVEALRCPGCGDHIDLSREVVEQKMVDPYRPGQKTIVYINHVSSCMDFDSPAVWRDGKLRVDGESYGEPELQPILKPPQPSDEIDLEKLAEKMGRNGWDTDYNETEDVVEISIFGNDTYTVDSSGAVYGDDALREKIGKAVKEAVKQIRN